MRAQQKRQHKNLIGKTVVVPGIAGNDPQSPDYRFGRVFAFRSGKADRITVRFEDQTKQDYDPGKLLLLLPATEIKKIYMLSLGKLEGDQVKVMRNAFLLLSKGRVKDAFTAVMSNELTRTFATINCREWLDQGHKLQ